MPTFNDIVKLINKSVEDFNKGIPGIQKDALNGILDQLRRLDVDSSNNIKTTVNNLKIVSSIKAKLNSLILTDDYLDHVKDFTDAYDQIANLQNQYWQTVEATFTPKPLLREIRLQAISDTVNSLTENGVGPNISDEIAGILRTAITTGGSYRELENQLRQKLTDNKKDDGLITKYTKQITTDAINQYARQYTKAVSDDLDFEWYDYANSLIETSRPFCISMHERRYFHKSEIPDLLKAKDLTYVNKKTGQREPVPIYDKTGLPQGMYDTENEANFLILLGGYNCGHQARPVTADQVKRNDPELYYKITKEKAPVLVKEPVAPPQPVKLPEPPPQPAAAGLGVFKPAASIKEAEDYAKDVLGVKYSNFKGAQVEAANIMNARTHALRSLMPEYKMNGIGVIQAMQRQMKADIIEAYKKSEFYTKISNSFGQKLADAGAQKYANAYVGRTDSGVNAFSLPATSLNVLGTPLDLSKYAGVYVNEVKAANLEALNKDIVRLEAQKWYFKGRKDFNSTMNHELGHELDNLLHITTDPEFLAIFRREHLAGLKAVTDRLSEYGATAGRSPDKRPQEMLAEAWGEFITVDQPRELATEIGTFVLRRYYEDFVQSKKTTFKAWSDNFIKQIRS